MPREPQRRSTRPGPKAQNRKDQKLLRKLDRKARQGKLSDAEQALLLDLQRTRRHPEHAQNFPHDPAPKPDTALTLHDLCALKTQSANQSMLKVRLEEDYHVAAIGSAGTGKTFLAMYFMLDPDHPRQKLVIFRSNVEGRDMGHRPGDTDEKMSDFEAPYRNVCAKLFGRPTAYDKLKAQGKIVFRSTSFERGVDYEDCELLVDECQNNNFHELDTLITRPAEGSRIVFCGDTIQSDLTKKTSDVTGLPLFLSIMEHLNDFKIVRFRPQDNVRSGISRDYLLVRERLMKARPEAFRKSGLAVVAA